MKRIYLLLSILAVSFLLTSCKESSTTSPTTTVPKKAVVIRETGADFDTIGEAIAAASAGNHIDVSAGTYTENLVVEKQLYLVGADENTTIIDGGGSGQVVRFTSGADGSDIRGFTIKNGEDGIYCQYTITIVSNIVKENSRYGIYSRYSTISGILVENNVSYGIFLEGDSSISETTVQGNKGGIYCLSSFSASIGITACDIENNSDWGVMCGSQTNPDLGGGALGSPGNNVIRGNGGLYFYDFYNCSPNAVKAENNRWDHTTAAEIDSIDIYDNDENASFGAVDFQPFLTSTVSLNSLRMKPRLLSASSLFKDFFRSLFRGDLPTSAIYLSSSFEPKIHLTRHQLDRARYRTLNDKRYYPPLMMRAGQ
jgi:hypothetical protein